MVKQTQQHKAKCANKNLLPVKLCDDIDMRLGHVNLNAFYFREPKNLLRQASGARLRNLSNYQEARQDKNKR